MDNIKASQIASFLNKELFGNDMIINKVTSIDNTDNNALSFCKLNTFQTNKECLILVHKNFEAIENVKFSYIRTDNPRRDFAKTIDKFFISQVVRKIDKSAVISKKCILGEDVAIGKNVVIGKNCKLGNGTVIYNNVILAENTVIGENCLIRSGAVIGEDGFGFDFEENGTPIKINHIGKVIVGDNVEIGNNVCISKGTIDDTIIGDNVKIDNLSHIGHNCFVGKNTIVTAGVIVGGSCKIGKNCWLGINSTIKQKMTIGNNVTVGMGAVINHSVNDDKVLMASDSMEFRDYVKLKQMIRRFK